jgi:hypothetical protein
MVKDRFAIFALPGSVEEVLRVKTASFSHQPKNFRAHKVGQLLVEVNQSLKKLEQLKSQFYRLEKQASGISLK